MNHATHTCPPDTLEKRQTQNTATTTTNNNRRKSQNDNVTNANAQAAACTSASSSTCTCTYAHTRRAKEREARKEPRATGGAPSGGGGRETSSGDRIVEEGQPLAGRSRGYRLSAIDRRRDCLSPPPAALFPPACFDGGADITSPVHSRTYRIPIFFFLFFLINSICAFMISILFV